MLFAPLLFSAIAMLFQQHAILMQVCNRNSESKEKPGFLKGAGHIF
jgi:hypothetical protein